MGAAFVAVAFAAVTLLGIAEGVDYQVGDNQGWQPPSDSSFYSNWASDKRFSVGDTLTFNFVTGVHDVAAATRADYDSCNVGAASNVLQTGPTTVTLNSTGTQYFLCTFTNHCSRGQKLAVTVGGGGGGGGSPSGSPPVAGDSPPVAGGDGNGSPPPPATTTPNSAAGFAASSVLVLGSFAIGAMVWV